MAFRNTPQEMEGEVDPVDGPVLMVPVLFAGRPDTLRCCINFGCSDFLVFEDLANARRRRLQFNFSPRGERVIRTLSDGSTCKFLKSRGTVTWFGTAINIEILAPAPQYATPPNPIVTIKPPSGRIFVGLPLLKGCELRVDFRSNPGSVIIRK